MKYTQHLSLILVVLFLTLAPLPAQDVTARLDSIEQRIERLEARLDSLIATLHGMEALIPANVIRNSSHLYFGITGPTGTLLAKEYFVINHNDDYKIAYWVAYYLSTSSLQGNQGRTDDFRPDLELPVGQRSELTDYRNSGYDRGHLAPAATFKRSREAMSATFLLSNMSPQTPTLNRNIWRILEEQVRQMINKNGEGWIFTGNVFMAILLRDETGNFEMYAFLMPNAREHIPGEPADYLIRIDKLEEITGYDFFPILEDEVENKLESVMGEGRGKKSKSNGGILR